MLERDVCLLVRAKLHFWIPLADRRKNNIVILSIQRLEFRGEKLEVLVYEILFIYELRILCRAPIVVSYRLFMISWLQWAELQLFVPPQNGRIMVLIDSRSASYGIVDISSLFPWPWAPFGLHAPCAINWIVVQHTRHFFQITTFEEWCFIKVLLVWILRFFW